MRSFFDWMKSKEDLLASPWLVLGKGPTFSKLVSFDISKFHVLSLNHVIRKQPATVAHMIDLNVVEACANCIEKNAAMLVLPWFPHVKHHPGRLNLCELLKKYEILDHMNRQDRLLWYNLGTARQQRAGSPVVKVRFFIGEVTLKLLAETGVRKIRSLGIDGGSDYSDEFADLREVTLLTNKRTTFNRQFEEIARTILNTRVDYAPLDTETPIRVWVGATESEMIPVKVLEYSIRKHATMSVEVVPIFLSNIDIPTPKDLKNHPRTPFSFQRFVIPEAAGYKGRAIYLDADMQVFRDIRHLWTVPFDGAEILTVRESGETGRRPQFSVMVMNCQELRWNIREIVSDLDCGKLSYEQLMYKIDIECTIRRDIDPIWNSIEMYKERETALLHYSDMQTQPWVSKENPLGYLWMRDLFEAIDSCFLRKADVIEHVNKGHIRPSLIYQIEKGIEDSYLLPKQARLLDRGFVAPYQSIHRHGSSQLENPIRVLRAAARHYYQKSPIYTLQRKWHNYLSR